MQLNLEEDSLKEILDLKNKYDDGEWWSGGEFNSIKSLKDRKGSLTYNKSAEMREFKDFIDELNLIDLQCKGNVFR